MQMTKEGDSQLMIPMETLDNQIDFNILDIIKRPPGSDFEYQFKQYREVVARKDNLDPIKQFSYSFDIEGNLYAVSLR